MSHDRAKGDDFAVTHECVANLQGVQRVGVIPTTRLLAQVLVAKYLDHLPLYRQEAIFERAGMAIARSTLAQWVGECGVQLQPLVDALTAELLKAPVLHADETPVDAQAWQRQDAPGLHVELVHDAVPRCQSSGLQLRRDPRWSERTGLSAARHRCQLDRQPGRRRLQWLQSLLRPRRDRGGLRGPRTPEVARALGQSPEQSGRASAEVHQQRGLAVASQSRRRRPPGRCPASRPAGSSARR